VFVAGLIQSDSGQFGLVHWQMLAAVRDGHGAADVLRRQKSDSHSDLGHGIRYQETVRE
jgi:hypothetical protein